MSKNISVEERQRLLQDHNGKNDEEIYMEEDQEYKGSTLHSAGRTSHSNFSQRPLNHTERQTESKHSNIEYQSPP